LAVGMTAIVSNAFTIDDGVAETRGVVRRYLH